MHFYPLMLLLFTFLRKVIEKILQFHPYKKNINFIIPFSLFFSEVLIGYIIFVYNSKKNRKEDKTNLKPFLPLQAGMISYISTESYESNDSNLKKIILIFFCCSFNFTGTIIRNSDIFNIGKKEESNVQLETRVRSIQIIISALLCYYALRLTFYKHQKLSLAIILFFLIVLIIIELCITVNIFYKILALLITSISCLFRAFLDVTEKYLFDYEYINIFIMIICEGISGVIFYIFYFISNETYQNQAKKFINNITGFDWTFVSFLLLILLLIIFTGFRTAYRVLTNKYYSPMSRALFDSVFDPFLLLYSTFTSETKDRSREFWIYFSFVIFSLFIIALFSLIYNDFIILYCCGLQYDSYIEITNRLYNQKTHQLEDYYDDNDNESVSSVGIGDTDNNSIIE